MGKFKEKQIVIHKIENTYDLGEIKQSIDYEEKSYTRDQGPFSTEEGKGPMILKTDYFTNFHTGDTASKTRGKDLFKIENEYAFLIVRKEADKNIIESIVNKMGHRDFMAALISYEKGCNEREAKEIYDKFMEDDSQTSMLSDFFIGVE